MLNVFAASYIAAIRRFFESLTNEANADDVVIFNVPYHLSLPLGQSTILNVYGMTRHPCLCPRPLIKSRQNNCPVKFRILGALSDKMFKTNNATVAYYRPHKNIEIFFDKSSFRRKILRPQKFTVTSPIGKTSVLSGSPSMNSKLPVLCHLARPNRELTVMVLNNLPFPGGRLHHSTSLNIP